MSFLFKVLGSAQVIHLFKIIDLKSTRHFSFELIQGVIFQILNRISRATFI